MSKDNRFSIIPGWIVTETRLRGKDLHVLCLLGRHTDKAGWCRRSQVKMAVELNCARSTIQASLDRLAEIGVVEKHEMESKDGRDSAHSYRVIYDRAPPEGYAFDAWQAEDEEQNILLDDQADGHPPAGQPAPPADIPAGGAGPESAPPAGPGPAPINDPLLTPPPELPPRGREAVERIFDKVDRKKVERDFKAWIKTWPKKGSEDFARNAWLALSEAERVECIADTPRYLQWAPKEDLTAPAVYLKARSWRLVPEDFGKTKRVVAAFCGKLWTGIWLHALSQKPTGRFTMTAFYEARIRDGHITLDELLREKRKEHGWPVATEMLDRARRSDPFVTPPDLLPHVQHFHQVKRDGDVFAAWHRLHEARGWPQIERALEWVWLPPIDDRANDLDAAVDRALTDWLATIERRNDDAA